MAEPVELAQHQRGALALGQVGEVGRSPQLLALADAVLESRAAPGTSPSSAVARRRRRIEIASLWAIRNSHGRSSKSARLVLQRRERPRHRALQRVLRVLLVAQDRAAVAVQRLVMALVDRRERRRVATRRARAQRALAPEPQRRTMVTHLVFIGSTRPWPSRGVVECMAANAQRILALLERALTAAGADRARCAR